MTDAVKDMQITGCRVHLTFRAMDAGRWELQADVQCGTGTQAHQQTVHSGPCPSREAAEQQALALVGKILGHNETRNTSPVANRPS